MNSDMGDRVNLSLDSQIGLLAKYIEDNFQSFISDDDLVVETAIKIMKHYKSLLEERDAMKVTL